eukprot:5076052-Prymnesium_polylepis.1
MGFRGTPVALNGPVILDLLVLRFSLFPAQAALRPLHARGWKIKSGVHVVLRDLMVVILVIFLGPGHGRITPGARPAGSRSPQTRVRTFTFHHEFITLVKRGFRPTMTGKCAS